MGALEKLRPCGLESGSDFKDTPSAVGLFAPTIERQALAVETVQRVTAVGHVAEYLPELSDGVTGRIFEAPRRAAFQAIAHSPRVVGRPSTLLRVGSWQIAT